MSTTTTQGERAVRPRGREAKLQAFGTQAVSTLYMIVRNIRMYDPDNEIFSQPLEMLREVINTVVAYDRRFDLQGAGTLLTLNGYLLRVEFSSLENVRHLTNEFKKRDIGGLSVERPVQIEDLKAFLRMFTAQAFADDGQLGGHVAIRVTKYRTIASKLKEQADKDIQEQRNLDRRKYAMTVYARAIYFMRRFLEHVKSGHKLPNTTAAGRIVRDFVDLCSEQKNHFLGLTCARSSDDYLAYHSVNTTLLSIVVGNALGLSRMQLFDLGKAALFHDIGVVNMDPAVLNKHGPLSAEEWQSIRQNPLFAAKIMLRGRPLDLSALKCILAAHEAKLHYAKPRYTETGQVEYVARGDIGLFGRIIHLASCYDALTSPRPYREAFSPETALGIMHSQMRHEFDPVLLEVFSAILRNQVVKSLGEQGATVEIL